MSFPGQRLQLRLVERRETAEKPLSFLQILNKADQPLDKRWRLYFSLGLTPKEGETRVLKIIIDGRYGYLEPTADWPSLPAGGSVEIPVEGWLFTHMPLQARQGFHLLTWETTPAAGVLTEPQCLPPDLLDINSTPNPWIAQTSPSCDIYPDSPAHRFRINNQGVREGEFTVIPTPKKLEFKGPAFRCLGFNYDDPEIGKVFAHNKGAETLPIRVRYDQKIEGYSIQVNSTEVVILSGSDTATFHAAQTLRQLITSQNLLQPCQIVDQPAFIHRGLFIDIARHFHGVDDLKTIIQAMAAYKMNRLQLGISNDEGWRLAIQGLPELTNIGGRRAFIPEGSKSVDALYPAWGDGPEECHNFLTGEEFIELLRFANQAHVEIIIEFNLPAHANALIRSIAASGRYEIVDPDDQSTYTSAQGYSRNVVNVCQPDTFVLTRRILETIAKYYSMAGLRLRHIHLGGDELPAGAWLGSPVCRNAPFWSPDWDMTSESDREAATGVLQKYYVESILNIIRDIDPDVMTGFWHEMAPFIPDKANTYITGWYTEDPPAGSIDSILSRQQNLVVANASFLYLDMPYSLHAEEPGLPWAAYTSTRRIHDFDPFDCWDIDSESNIKGIQAQLWTETVYDQATLHYYLFPRLLAVAERAWCKKFGPWSNFAHAVGSRELAHLDALGIKYRLPPPGIQIDNHYLKANSTYPGLIIRYNQQGENPTANDPELIDQLDINGISEIRLAVFSPSGERSSRVEIVKNLLDANLN